MRWIVTSIKWLMLVSGALTCTMLYAAIHCIDRDGHAHLLAKVLLPMHEYQGDERQLADAGNRQHQWVVLFIGYFIGVRNAPRIETSVRGV